MFLTRFINYLTNMKTHNYSKKHYSNAFFICLSKEFFFFRYLCKYKIHESFKNNIEIRDILEVHIENFKVDFHEFAMLFNREANI